MSSSMNQRMIQLKLLFARQHAHSEAQCVYQHFQRPCFCAPSALFPDTFHGTFSRQRSSVCCA